MKNKTLFSAVVAVVAVVSMVTFLGYRAQESYARDGSSGDREDSVKASEGASLSETPDNEIKKEEDGQQNTSEQQSQAVEKINEAQSKLNELKLKLTKEVNSVPQNVQGLADLADQKLAEAKTALNNQDFGKALGQARSVESLVRNALHTLENEQEAENVQSDLNKEIDDEDITSIEIDTLASESGSLSIEHKDKTHTRRSVPFSSTPLFEIQTDEGTIGAHIASGSRAVIDNDGLDIKSDFPLILNVASKTFSVQTPFGLREIKALPAKSFASVSDQDKPDSLNNVSLLQEGDKLIFQADGVRQGRVFGLIPLTVSVKTAVDAQTGEVVSVDKPWFISLLGPLFR